MGSQRNTSPNAKARTRARWISRHSDIRAESTCVAVGLRRCTVTGTSAAKPRKWLITRGRCDCGLRSCETPSVAPPSAASRTSGSWHAASRTTLLPEVSTLRVRQQSRGPPLDYYHVNSSSSMEPERVGTPGGMGKAGGLPVWCVARRRTLTISPNARSRRGWPWSSARTPRSRPDPRIVRPLLIGSRAIPGGCTGPPAADPGGELA